MSRTARIFAQIDVNYFEDDRVLEAGPAWQLHFAAILHCKRTLSDGQLSRRQLNRVAPESVGDVQDAIDALVRVGLFDASGDLISLRSWTTWNGSAEDVEAIAKGGEYGNHLRWHRNRNVVKTGCAYCSDRGESGGDIAPESGGESQSRDREDADTESDVEGRSKSRTRAARLNADFEITDSMKSWAVRRGIKSDLARETEKFINHFVGTGATKRDWTAAWRNWLLKADEYGATSSGQSKSAAARARVLGQIGNADHRALELKA